MEGESHDRRCMGEIGGGSGYSNGGGVMGKEGGREGGRKNE